MSERSDRILEAIKKAGLSYGKLSQMTGIPKSALQRYATGETEKISIERIEAIARAVGVSRQYITGWDENKEYPENMTLLDDTSFIKIPVVGRVAAGLTCYADMDISEYEYVSPNSIVRGESYVFLTVTGDSMYPDIREGDLLLVKCQSSVDSGSIAVVIIDDEDGVVKKIVYGNDYVELQSANPMYPPRRFEGKEAERIRIFGLVKEIKRKL